MFESVTSTNELDWSTKPKGGLAHSTSSGKQQVSRTFHRTTGRSRQSSFSSYGICQGMISGIRQRQQDIIRHNNYRRTIPLLFWNSLILNWFFFTQEMNSFGKPGVYNPGHLFGQICNKSSQFRGFQQQDAHELLRHLLEGVRTEEVKRQKSAVLKNFDLTEKSDKNSVPGPVNNAVFLVCLLYIKFFTLHFCLYKKSN